MGLTQAIRKVKEAQWVINGGRMVGSVFIGDRGDGDGDARWGFWSHDDVSRW